MTLRLVDGITGDVLFESETENQPAGIHVSAVTVPETDRACTVELLSNGEKVMASVFLTETCPESGFHPGDRFLPAFSAGGPSAFYGSEDRGVVLRTSCMEETVIAVKNQQTGETVFRYDYAPGNQNEKLEDGAEVRIFAEPGEENTDGILLYLPFRLGFSYDTVYELTVGENRTEESFILRSAISLPEDGTEESLGSWMLMDPLESGNALRIRGTSQKPEDMLLVRLTDESETVTYFVHTYQQNMDFVMERPDRGSVLVLSALSSEGNQTKKIELPASNLEPEQSNSAEKPWEQLGLVPRRYYDPSIPDMASEPSTTGQNLALLRPKDGVTLTGDSQCVVGVHVSLQEVCDLEFLITDERTGSTIPVGTLKAEDMWDPLYCFFEFSTEALEQGVTYRLDVTDGTETVSSHIVLQPGPYEQDMNAVLTNGYSFDPGYSEGAVYYGSEGKWIPVRLAFRDDTAIHIMEETTGETVYSCTLSPGNVDSWQEDGSYRFIGPAGYYSPNEYVAYLWIPTDGIFDMDKRYVFQVERQGETHFSFADYRDVPQYQWESVNGRGFMQLGSLNLNLPLYEDMTLRSAEEGIFQIRGTCADSGTEVRAMILDADERIVEACEQRGEMELTLWPDQRDYTLAIMIGEEYWEFGLHFEGEGVTKRADADDYGSWDGWIPDEVVPTEKYHYWKRNSYQPAPCMRGRAVTLLEPYDGGVLYGGDNYELVGKYQISPELYGQMILSELYSEETGELLNSTQTLANEYGFLHMDQSGITTGGNYRLELTAAEETVCTHFRVEKGLGISYWAMGDYNENMRFQELKTLQNGTYIGGEDGKLVLEASGGKDFSFVITDLMTGETMASYQFSEKTTENTVTLDHGVKVAVNPDEYSEKESQYSIEISLTPGKSNMVFRHPYGISGENILLDANGKDSLEFMLQDYLTMNRFAIQTTEETAVTELDGWTFKTPIYRNMTLTGSRECLMPLEAEKSPEAQPLYILLRTNGYYGIQFMDTRYLTENVKMCFQADMLEYNQEYQVILTTKDPYSEEMDMDNPPEDGHTVILHVSLKEGPGVRMNGDALPMDGIIPFHSCEGTALAELTEQCLQKMETVETGYSTEFIKLRLGKENAAGLISRSFSVCDPNADAGEVFSDCTSISSMGSQFISQVYRFQMEDMYKYTEERIFRTEEMYECFGPHWKNLSYIDFAGLTAGTDDGSIYYWLPMYYSDENDGILEGQTLYIFAYVIRPGADRAYLDSKASYAHYGDYTTEKMLLTDPEIVEQFLKLMDAEQNILSPEENAYYLTLQKGAEGESVRILQSRLRKEDCLESSVDGRYSDLVAQAVRRYQSAAGLPATGIADSATQQMLYDNQAEIDMLKLWMNTHSRNGEDAS